MKVLIISVEVWQNGTNGGNVLSNIFEGTGFEFAQIYCSPGIPDNNLCSNYYQMTDRMAMRNVLKHERMGKRIVLSGGIKKINEVNVAAPNDRAMYSFFHKHRWGIFYAGKDILWSLCDWKTESLSSFIDEFNPDVIFAPCYGNVFMLKLTRFVADYTRKKVISYISDDSYTLKQFRLSPYFWINRMRVRKALRKTFPYYSLIYTMTEEQKEQCEKDFGAHMKILRKSAQPPNLSLKKHPDGTIGIVYAGGIYLNRWKVLARLAEEIEKINASGVSYHLDIYTGNELNKKQENALNVNNASTVHPAVAFEELQAIYDKADIALHVESFDLKNRLTTRMSFSTKIVDCLSSGCAVMAIAWDKQAGYRYLKDNDAAICVDNMDKIGNALLEIKSNPELLEHYQNRAAEICVKNHSHQANINMIRTDFESIY